MALIKWPRAYVEVSSANKDEFRKVLLGLTKGRSMTMGSEGYHDTHPYLALLCLRDMAIEHVFKVLKNLLNTAITVNKSNRNAFELAQLEPGNFAALRLHFFRQMQLFPNLSGIQWGTENGDYIGVLDLGNRTPTLEIKQSSLSRHKYAFALDEHGNQTETCLGLAFDYNPRDRPWYEGAWSDSQAHWSPVYQYSSDVSVQLGVMATLSVCDQNDKRVGVLGVDIALTHISDLLMSVAEQWGGTYCLIERSGFIIGSSIHHRPFNIQGGRAQRLYALTCSSGLINKVLEQTLLECSSFAAIQQRQQLTCNVEGNQYFIDIQPLECEGGLDWLLVSCLSASQWGPQGLNSDDNAAMFSLASLQQTNQSLAVQIRQHVAALNASKQALQESEERWLLALKGTNDGIWDWHLETNEVFFSERWQQILGYAPGELAYHFEEWKQRVHPEDLSRVMAALQAHLMGETEYYAIEHRTRCKDGSYKWVLDRGRALWNAKGTPVRMVGSRSDITERKNMEARLIYQAEHDTLTDLLNRNAILGQLDRCLQKPPSSFTLLLIDIDRFKGVNDSLGHAKGDQLILNFAQTLKGLVRPADAVGRLSGDEFVVVIQPALEEIAIAMLVDRINASLQKVAIQLNLCTPISASIGITSSQQSVGEPQDFLRDADIAMYAAKYAGGNQAVIFSPTLREQSFKDLMIELALKQAVECQQFIPFFQPIMCLKTLMPIGLETLVRWSHPQRGIVTPNEFVPIAEKTGLILPIGQWMLEESCRQLQQWHRQFSHTFPLVLNVNVSMHQFYQPDFIYTIDHLLEAYQLEPRHLRLEITESCFMEKTEVALSTMNALYQRQISLCIDDFGTGYSSLSYLHQLPVESLKIDQSFVARVVNSQQGIVMIKAILAMSQSLGIKVIAEGIETIEQLAKLQELGCEFGQGYLFSPPQNAAVIESWFHTFSTRQFMAG